MWLQNCVLDLAVWVCFNQIYYLISIRTCFRHHTELWAVAERGSSLKQSTMQIQTP